MQPLLLEREHTPAAVWASALRVREDAPPVDFAVHWKSAWREFFASVAAVFTGPRPEKEDGARVDRPLPVEWIRAPVPGRSMLASVLWHVAIISLLILPIWGFLPEVKPTLAPVQIELTWYGEPKDLPPISLPAQGAKVPSAAKKIETPQPNDAPAADAFHPRQTILSLPVHITHPRQTLIQPSASAEPPKIVTSLPNIVQWPAQALPKPRLQYSTSASTPVMKQRANQDMAAPEVANSEKNSGPINIASPAAPKLAPQMSISAMSARATQRKPAPSDLAPAPDVASPGTGDANLTRIIALSATPAPPAPNPNVPQGNLAARISISPDGGKSGAAAGSSSGTAGGSTSNTGTANATNGDGSSNANSLPATIMVSPSRAPVGNGGGTASVGIGAGSGIGHGLGVSPGNIGGESATRHAPGVAAARTNPSASGARVEGARTRTIDPTMPPEKILSGKEVYTLHVNLPNLTSASGSWVLNFAQLDENDGPPFHPRTELSGPAPLATVDPKYPQTLIAEHVRGQVILYAIIRKDGSVDSIQIVQGLDPLLDRNAMNALAQWKFSPGKRAGEPIDLEAVVYIPFNYRDSIAMPNSTQ
jgi:TonB family protein